MLSVAVVSHMKSRFGFRLSWFSIELLGIHDELSFFRKKKRKDTLFMILSLRYSL